MAAVIAISPQSGRGAWPLLDLRLSPAGIACDGFRRPLTRAARMGRSEEEGHSGTSRGQRERVICSTRSRKIRHRRSSSWVSTELAADRSAAWLISSAAAYR